jgi:methylglutaconyl-CoA hydratase
LILYQVENGIARVTLNRPEKRNALNSEVVGELRAAITRSAEDQAVRAVLLSGAGKDFCSGADLSSLQKSFDSGPLENMADARNLAELFLAMRRHPRPVIAAVKGRALAGGCGLATAADVILASETAQFGYPEVNIGFVPAMVMAILRRSISEKRAFDLITMGEIIAAQTAYEMGLVTRVLADETFEVEVEAYAGKLAGKPASALALCKQLLYHIDGMGIEAAIESGVQVNAIARMTEDCRRGVETFLSSKAK